MSNREPKPRQPKSWTEKYTRPAAASVQRVERACGDFAEGDRMLIATPALVEAAVREIPPGQTRTIKQLRAELAARHEADGTCPLTTGIFLRIAAEAAWERQQAGESLDETMPFWRVVDPAGPLAKKLACGPEFVRQQREREQGPAPAAPGRKRRAQE